GKLARPSSREIPSAGPRSRRKPCICPLRLDRYSAKWTWLHDAVILGRESYSVRGVGAMRLAELDGVPIRIDDHEIANNIPRLFGRRTLRRYAGLAQLLTQPIQIGGVYLEVAWPSKPLA